MSHRTDHGFMNGPIEVVSLIEMDRGSIVRVKVGDAELDIEATRGGRKVFLRVRRGQKTKVVVEE